MLESEKGGKNCKLLIKKLNESLFGGQQVCLG